MAIDRGTRKATFAYLLQAFSILGVLGGAGLGVYQALGDAPSDLLMNALRLGLFGFIGGTIVGIVLGTIAVIFATIFR
ncbi:MAG: hypothetical protein JSV16_07185 [Candidatus Hydrogenedentota bacterium]|nr:MAG: hypothetical protein JSV16_07185 [Candidatus Hydrogenedentota bacterium]